MAGPEAGATGGCGPVPPEPPAEQAASPASTPSGSIHRISRNTSTAIMCATLSLARPTVLVIHDDGEALDALTRLFEGGGFEVITAVTGFRAQAYLEGDRPIDLHLSVTRMAKLRPTLDLLLLLQQRCQAVLGVAGGRGRSAHRHRIASESPCVPYSLIPPRES